MKQYNLKTNVKLMLNIFVCLILLSAVSTAQETSSSLTEVKSTNSASSEQTETTTGDYEIKSSVEIGVRGVDVNGNENKYRSDLNYKSGVRVFDSTFLATAKDGKGKAFDSLLFTATGWGADRNGYTRINMEKLGWYKFNSSIRRLAYFNSLTNFALNQHTQNKNRTIGDFDVTFLPQNEKLKFRLGYSFNHDRGIGGTTYDFDRDEFPILTDYKSDANDVRFGVDAKVLGFNLSFTEGYRRFKNDTSYSIDSPQLGNNTNPRSSLTTFSREMPERGRTFYHQFSFHRTFAKKVDFTGRIIHADSTVKFNMIERLTGLNRSGNPVVLDESTVVGDTKRPNTLGDFGITIFATDKLRISNTFGFNSYRITGGNTLFDSVMLTNPAGTPLPTTFTNTLTYRLTNYRRYINTLEGDYDVNQFFSFYLGYRYTNRKVTLNGLDLDIIGQSQTTDTEIADNNTNSFLAGFKAKPVPKKWTIYFDLEHGAADNSFTRVANYDFTNVRIRNRINATNNLSFNLSLETKDNTNPSFSGTPPVTTFAADVKNRIFSGSFDWMVDPRANISGGYTYNHLTSEIPVIFPISNVFGQGTSRYLLRSNSFFLDAWLQPHPRFSAFLSYRITKDTGNGDSFDPANYLIVGNYPLQYQSPEIRLIFKINRYIDWNVGYQYYDYNEKFIGDQNYSAHLPYTSLRFYFGRNDR
jgi:hypothetical protein